VSPTSKTAHTLTALVTGATSVSDGGALARCRPWLPGDRARRERLARGRGDRQASNIARAGPVLGATSRSADWPACRQAGEVDVLVNNAGFSCSVRNRRPVTTPRSTSGLAANVRGAYQLVAALAPAMRAGQRQHRQRLRRRTHRTVRRRRLTCATKAALTAMTRAWAAEYSPSVCGATRGPRSAYTNGADSYLIASGCPQPAARSRGPTDKRECHRILGP